MKLLSSVVGALLLSALIGQDSGQAAPTADAVKKIPPPQPTPYRLPDGHLNWTGFWVPVGGLLERNIGLGGTSPGVPGRVPPFSRYSELKSPYKDKLATAQKDAASGKVADPVANCFPPGMPRMMGMIYGMEFLQTPGQIAITSEWQAASRRVWLTQATHTDPDELDPTYTGESIGHWEGDVLVVDTVGIRSDVPLNYMSLPHGDRLHVVERFTETQPGILVDEIRVEDPDVFAAPWTETETYRYRPDLRIREFVCLENNRNVGANGEAVFK